MVRKVSTITISLSSVRTDSLHQSTSEGLTPLCRIVFGSAQLRTHKYLRPKAIHDADILEEFSKDYMYLSYIRYINSVSMFSPRSSARRKLISSSRNALQIKTASLRWHSPMLDDISGVKSWDKVNSGMLKMYQAEVLAKLPVAQHFLFGQLLPYPETPELETHHSESDVHIDEHGHLHVRGEAKFGDCCGIAIPSAFAAAAEEKKRAGGLSSSNPAIKPIPFD